VIIRYADVIRAKRRAADRCGISIDESDIHPSLFDHQRSIVEWACRMGRAAIFADTGLGKTRMQLEWLRHASRDGKGLILAPIAVGDQTIAEAAQLGWRIGGGTNIDVINYERLHKIDPAEYTAVVLDESSIIKSYDGSTRTALIEAFAGTPYRLACTATPAPNDHTELGNHAEFLGVCSRQEMLAEYFVHDGSSSSARGWRLKGHAVKRFWEWVSSWAVVIRKPSDLGFPDDLYSLPPLTHHRVVVEVPDNLRKNQGTLFVLAASTLQDQRDVRRLTVQARCEAAATAAKSGDGPCIVWCELNDESATVKQILGDDAVEVTGSDHPDIKREKLVEFASGNRRYIVTKPSIAGFGLNWQHCSRMVFVGLTHSFEQYYQAVRRCWRFGQQSEVHVTIVQSEADGAIVSSIAEKAARFEELGDEVASVTREHQMASVFGSRRPGSLSEADKHMIIPEWMKPGGTTCCALIR
jgi:hypothetical protein